eukprot:6178221-Pleurochrysis_carterae.AAC.2
MANLGSLWTISKMWQVSALRPPTMALICRSTATSLSGRSGTRRSGAGSRACIAKLSPCARTRHATAPHESRTRHLVRAASGASAGRKALTRARSACLLLDAVWGLSSVSRNGHWDSLPQVRNRQAADAPLIYHLDYANRNSVDTKTGGGIRARQAVGRTAEGRGEGGGAATSKCRHSKVTDASFLQFAGGARVWHALGPARARLEDALCEDGDSADPRVVARVQHEVEARVLPARRAACERGGGTR